MYQLYYYPNNASLAPHFILHHLDVPYELILVDRDNQHHKSADYLRLNPAGRIPTLVDDGQPIFESPAICVHLAEKYPSKTLLPKVGDTERPLFFQWMMFLTNTLQAELMVRYYPHRHTVDSSAIASIIAAQDMRIGEALTIIDEQLSKGQYLLGDQLSACDFFLFMLSEWALTISPSPMQYRYLGQYLERLSWHPTIAAVCGIEGISLIPFRLSE
ncbi:glutathione S-transferase family protein [Vibrio sp. E150_011]